MKLSDEMTLRSIPYAVRFRQCVIDYLHPTNTSKKPLYNALKYASSFPVIFLSAAQRVVVSELLQEKGDEIEGEAWHGEHPLFRLWCVSHIIKLIISMKLLSFRLLSVAVNSLYSFWWDVSNDWGLDFLQPKSKTTKHHPPRELILPTLQTRVSGAEVEDGGAHSRHLVHPRRTDSGSSFLSPNFKQQPYPWGLRPVLLYPLPAYPLAVFANLVLRLTWSIKLSSHLHTHTSGAVIIFWIEVAELLRRWMWVFFRVEWELVKRMSERGEYSPAIEDFELISTEYDVKDDGPDLS